MKTAVAEQLRALGEKEQAEVLEPLIRSFFLNRAAEEKREKLERFRHLNRLALPHQILLCGSSLMEQFPVQELLVDKGIDITVYNRGVGGFTSEEMLSAMDVCVYDLQPSRVFINIGTNDMNVPDYTEEALIHTYRKILNGIRENLPDTEIYMLAYYPVSPEKAETSVHGAMMVKYRTNERIRTANEAVRALAEEMHAVFLDCNAGIIDETGAMKENYSVDGVHMYGDGYMHVLDCLLPYFR